MKLSSLSMRLGLTVSVLAGVLVVLLAALAFFSLSHELDTLAKRALEGKLTEVESRLSRFGDQSEIQSGRNALLAQVKGHDDMDMAIYDATGDNKALFKSGTILPDPAIETDVAGVITEQVSYSTNSNIRGQHFLTASKRVQLKNGVKVYVVLSMDCSNNQALLSAYLRSTMIALPLLLMLCGLSAWAVVQRGLLPLREFRKVAEMVTAQDLSHRLSVVKMPLELSELAQGINVMLDRIDSGVQQLSQFSDDLAHELRSPISNLMGKAQVTLSRERPAEEYKAALESCTEELERIARIVSDMLFLAQVGNPATPIPFETIRLEEEILKVIDMFSLSAQEKCVSFSVMGSGKIHGNRLMIQRAISNLISNAIRHCPAGQSISIDIVSIGEQLSLQVGNPGSGIEPQHLPHVFDRFYRVDDSRSRAEGGAGLGLAIVQSIMGQHNGTADVQSFPGGMTVFRLGFPHLGITNA